MAELGSTGGNLDNILQYLLQRIEKVGIAEGVTGRVARFADLSDVPAATSGKTQYWGWTGSAYAWLNAPEGGGGSNVDPSDYYTKTQVNNLLADYAKTSALPDMSKYVLLETYDEGINGVKAWATSEADKAAAAAQGNAIATAKDYTDSKASATLSAANANAATIIEQALKGYVKNETLSEYAKIAWADGKFAKLAEANRFTANNYITGRLYLSNGNYGVYCVCDNNESVYLYRHIAEAYDVTFMRMANFNGGGLVEIGEQYSPGTLKIGNAYITYDSKNNALMVSDGSGGAVNIVAMGDVAAFGGLGSGFDTLTDLTLTNKLTAKSASITDTLTAGGINVTGAKEGYINLAGGNIEDCYQITGDEIYANDFFYLRSNKISLISASGNATSGYVVKITIDGKTYAMDAIMLT
jgi:hypothetical protein